MVDLPAISLTHRALSLYLSYDNSALLKILPCQALAGGAFASSIALDLCVISSVVERSVHIGKAAGSIPASRTEYLMGQARKAVGPIPTGRTFL